MVVWFSVLILRFVFPHVVRLYLPVFPLKLITDSTFGGLVVGDRGQELIHLYNKRG